MFETARAEAINELVGTITSSLTEIFNDLSINKIASWPLPHEIAYLEFKYLANLLSKVSTDLPKMQW